VFCLEGEWTKGKPAVPAVVSRRKFWPVAQKKGWVWQMQGLTSATMKRFVESFAGKHGLDVSSGLVHELAQALPLEAGAARRELEKIALAAGESRTVQAAHLSVVSHRPDMDIFSFLSAAVAGKSAEKVWAKVFAEHNVSGDDKIFFAFLRLVHREARIFWELAVGEKPSAYVPRPAMAEKSGLAKRLGPGGAAAILDLVMSAEYGVKSGERTPEQAFEALVAGLHQISR
jgi:DNA polymerase-3 subunit delta